MSECVINQAVSLVFVANNLTTGKTTFPDIKIFVNGVLNTSPPTIVYAEIGGGVYTMTFTPNVSGRWTIFIEGKVQQEFNAVIRDSYIMLTNVEDECLGSWSWDKTTGVLQAFRQNGTLFATFNVVDSLDSASRERV